MLLRSRKFSCPFRIHNNWKAHHLGGALVVTTISKLIRSLKTGAINKVSFLIVIRKASSLGLLARSTSLQSHAWTALHLQQHFLKCYAQSGSWDLQERGSLSLSSRGEASHVSLQDSGRDDFEKGLGAHCHLFITRMFCWMSSLILTLNTLRPDYLDHLLRPRTTNSLDPARSKM